MNRWSKTILPRASFGAVLSRVSSPFSALQLPSIGPRPVTPVTPSSGQRRVKNATYLYAYEDAGKDVHGVTHYRVLFPAKTRLPAGTPVDVLQANVLAYIPYSPYTSGWAIVSTSQGQGIVRGGDLSP